MSQVAEKFKICQNCQKSWLTRAEFLADKEVSVVGYQANFVALGKGFFLFNHSCQNTLSVAVQAFVDLYAGPIFQESMSGSVHCAGYCLQRNILKPCPEACECAYVRAILQHLKSV